MKSYGLIAVLFAGLLAGPAVYAQQSAAPASSTGQCKDGSYTNHATKKNACSGHQDMKKWYTAAPAATAAPGCPGSLDRAPPRRAPSAPPAGRVRR